MGLGLLAPEVTLTDFYPPHVDVGPACSMSPPLLPVLDGCGFFKSIAVRLLFNLISVGSERWLFYILVVILMWLYEEMICVYLCRHLDSKSYSILPSSVSPFCKLCVSVLGLMCVYHYVCFFLVKRKRHIYSSFFPFQCI